MGRVKGRHLKVAAMGLLNSSADKFSQDFKTTNDLLKKLGIMPQSKKERNKLAGIISSDRRLSAKHDAQKA